MTVNSIIDPTTSYEQSYCYTWIWGSGADFTYIDKYVSFPLSTIDLLGFGDSPVSKQIEDYSVDLNVNY